jgi:hypothetical protein
MLNKYLDGSFYHAAVISTKRTHRVEPMQQILGSIKATWYVTEGEEQAYVQAGVPFGCVVGCPPNISEARNMAIADAREFGSCSIQTSDDLRHIRKLSLLNGKRHAERITLEAAIGVLLVSAAKTGRLYGGVAVTSNTLNYTGLDLSLDKFVACDLIFVAPECPLFDTTMALKEDYDMTLELIVNGDGVFRCDNILCDFPHRDNKGGANTYRDAATEAAVTEKMFAKWGSLIEPHRTRRGQISLRRNAIAQEVDFKRRTK